MLVEYNLNFDSNSVDFLTLLGNDFVASASRARYEGSIFVWDLNTGKLKFKLDATKGSHKDGILALEYLGDNLLASGSLDKTIKIWNLNCEGNLKYSLNEAFSDHSERIESLATLDNNVLVSGSSDWSFIYWNLTTGDRSGIIGNWNFSRLNYRSNPVEKLLFIKKYKILVQGMGDGVLIITDLTTGLITYNTEINQIGYAYKHTKRITCLAFLENLNLFASASEDKSVKLWDLSKYLESKIIDLKYTFNSTNQGHQNIITDLAVLDNGLLASSSLDGTVKIWYTTNGNLKFTFSHNKNGVLTLAYLGENILASGLADSTIMIYNVISGKLLYIFDWQTGGHTKKVNKLIVGGHRFLISGSDDSLVKVWNLTNLIF